jgi:hypothetical protein
MNQKKLIPIRKNHYQFAYAIEGLKMNWHKLDSRSILDFPCELLIESIMKNPETSQS